jgi:hypothetical protein
VPLTRLKIKRRIKRRQMQIKRRKALSEILTTYFS